MDHVVTYVKISFLLSQIIFHCMSHFVHTLVAGHWGYFHILANVNNSAMNTGAHVRVLALTSFRYVPRSGIAESYGNSRFNFFKEHEFQFLHILFNVCHISGFLLLFKKNSHTNECEVISHCGVCFLHNQCWRYSPICPHGF